MTSGKFQSYSVSDITIVREARQRKTLDPSYIAELADSISRLGLIHPIVIDQDGVLVAGECRLTAVRELGWDKISVQFAEDLSDLELKAIELEENIKRKNLSWQEECLAVREFHENKIQLNEGWTQDDTAKALGVSRQTIGEKIEVAVALKDENVRVTAAPKYSTAKNIVSRESARKKSSVLESLEAPEEREERIAPIIHAEFQQWRQTYKGAPFNFIHCDFPYGVNLHKSGQSAGAAFGTYDDSVDVYWALLDELGEAMSAIIHESAHLMFWFSMDYYVETVDRLEGMGWRVNRFPLIWMKSDNTGIIPDASRGPRRIYETALFASRGDRKIVSAVSNAFAHPGREKEIHSNEKPVAMLNHFMRMVVDEYSVVLDPTCGSANALKAAEQLGAHSVLGVERDEEFFKLASENYYAEPELFAATI